MLSWIPAALQTHQTPVSLDNCLEQLIKSRRMKGDVIPCC